MGSVTNLKHYFLTHNFYMYLYLYDLDVQYILKFIHV